MKLTVVARPATLTKANLFGGNIIPQEDIGAARESVEIDTDALKGWSLYGNRTVIVTVETADGRVWRICACDQERDVRRELPEWRRQTASARSYGVAGAYRYPSKAERAREREAKKAAKKK